MGESEITTIVFRSGLHVIKIFQTRVSKTFLNGPHSKYYHAGAEKVHTVDTIVLKIFV